jgi:UPF0716 protein FxsA
MLLILVALFVLGPIAEIWVLLATGGVIGAPAVIGLCLLTAIIGGVLLRLQGLAALSAARRDLDAGRAPVEAAVDGVFLVLAAPMLLLPGFLTDFAGFLLLVPPLRHAMARWALARLRRRMEAGEARVFITRL